MLGSDPAFLSYAISSYRELMNKGLGHLSESCHSAAANDLASASTPFTRNEG
jgi:hypothetical protein